MTDKQLNAKQDNLLFSVGDANNFWGESMRIGICSGLGGVAVSGGQEPGPNPAFFFSSLASPAGWGAIHFDNTFPIFTIQCRTKRSARIH